MKLKAEKSQSGVPRLGSYKLAGMSALDGKLKL
jgi:hypothetical protein